MNHVVDERRILTTADVAGARDEVRAIARDVGLGGRSDDAALVVSELVTNGLEHGSGAPVRLVITRTGDRLDVAVESEIAEAQPVVVAEPPDPSTPRGRGLYIARSLSDSFTLVEDADTVRVVCTFDVG